jgi:hypothetical protein
MTAAVAAGVFVPITPGGHWDADRKRQQYDAYERTYEMSGREWLARECVEFCRLTITQHPHDHQQRAILGDFCAAQRIDMPEACAPVGWLTEDEMWAAVRARLLAPGWWMRQIDKRNRREGEQRRIKAGAVRLYCSDTILEDMRESRARLRDWVNRADLHDTETGESVPLSLVAAGSVSTPAIMRAELMTRIRGMADYARISGHACRFITITAPSKYHRNSRKWGVNAWPDFMGPVVPFEPTPREVQQYLCKCWARCRAALKRADLPTYGVRIAEPHTDACPHWHLLCWFETTKQARAAVSIIRRYFLATDGQEKGAAHNRVKTITIQLTKPGKDGKDSGGAVGYVAKYLAKNIDGFSVADHHDRNGQTVTDGEDGSARVKSWAGCWGMRQFQFFGPCLPPVGLWRELRRIRDGEAVPLSLYQIWAAADRGDWLAFMLLYPICAPTLEKQDLLSDLAALAELSGGIDNVTDEAIADLTTLNQYGEPRSRVRGLLMPAGDYSLITRSKRWELRVTAGEETPATPEALIQADAVFEWYQSGNVDWDGLVDKAHNIGAWGWARPQGPPTLDLWQ